MRLFSLYPYVAERPRLKALVFNDTEKVASEIPVLFLLITTLYLLQGVPFGSVISVAMLALPLFASAFSALQGAITYSLVSHSMGRGIWRKAPTILALKKHNLSASEKRDLMNWALGPAIALAAIPFAPFSLLLLLVVLGRLSANLSKLACPPYTLLLGESGASLKNLHMRLVATSTLQRVAALIDLDDDSGDLSASEYDWTFNLDDWRHNPNGWEMPNAENAIDLDSFRVRGAEDWRGSVKALSEIAKNVVIVTRPGSDSVNVAWELEYCRSTCAAKTVIVTPDGRTRRHLKRQLRKAANSSGTTQPQVLSKTEFDAWIRSTSLEMHKIAMRVVHGRPSLLEQLEAQSPPGGIEPKSPSVPGEFLEGPNSRR